MQPSPLSAADEINCHNADSPSRLHVNKSLRSTRSTRAFVSVSQFHGWVNCFRPQTIHCALISSMVWNRCSPISIPNSGYPGYLNYSRLLTQSFCCQDKLNFSRLLISLSSKQLVAVTQVTGSWVITNPLLGTKSVNQDPLNKLSHFRSAKVRKKSVQGCQMWHRTQGIHMVSSSSSWSPGRRP